MSDDAEQPFDPNPGMFFAPVENESTFLRTPANINNDFIQEARQNVATAASAPPSEARPVLVPEAEAPSPHPARSVAPAAAAATAVKQRKRISKFRVTNTDEYPETKASPAAASKPAVTPSVAPFSSPNSVPAAKKRKRQPGKKQLNARVIPRSLDECDEADRELINLRESGAEWKTIRARWAEMTGEQTATSNLPNRYARLKSNFTVIKEEDNALLIAAKREVEESFENQKWDLISRVVTEKGGENYAAVVLKRQYKKLMVGAGAVPPLGVVDADFAIDLPESDGE